MAIVRAFITLILLAFSSFAAAKNVIVQIAYTDELALLRANASALSATLQEQYPDARVVTYVQPTNRLGYAKQSDYQLIRQKMLNQIKNLRLTPDEQISLLVLSTHASTENNVTKLSLVGDISENGLSDDAKVFFKPFVGKFAADSKIIFESCSTMCGTDKSAAARTQQLFNFLGITTGSLFGMIMPLTAEYGAKWSWKHAALLGIASIAFANGISIIEIYQNPEILRELLSNQDFAIDFGLQYLKNAAFFSVVALPLKRFVWDQQDQRNNMAADINIGRIIKLEQDKEIEITTAQYNLDREKIFGFKSCKSALSR